MAATLAITPVITSREQVDDETSFLVCTDNRILGMDSCGCDAPSMKEVAWKVIGRTQLIVVNFYHPESRCLAAIMYEDGKGKYYPLSFEQYSLLLEEASEL